MNQPNIIDYCAVCYRSDRYEIKCRLNKVRQQICKRFHLYFKPIKYIQDIYNFEIGNRHINNSGCVQIRKEFNCLSYLKKDHFIDIELQPEETPPKDICVSLNGQIIFLYKEKGW